MCTAAITPGKLSRHTSVATANNIVLRPSRDKIPSKSPRNPFEIPSKSPSPQNPFKIPSKSPRLSRKWAESPQNPLVALGIPSKSLQNPLKIPSSRSESLQNPFKIPSEIPSKSPQNPRRMTTVCPKARCCACARRIETLWCYTRLSLKVLSRDSVREVMWRTPPRAPIVVLPFALWGHRAIPRFNCAVGVFPSISVAVSQFLHEPPLLPLAHRWRIFLACGELKSIRQLMARIA